MVFCLPNKRTGAQGRPNARVGLMDNRPQQRFCINCGQPLAPGTAFCVACGTPVGAPPVNVPGQYPAGAHPGYAPPSLQSPAQTQDDLLMAALIAGSAPNQVGQNRQQRTRRRGFGLRACGCLLLLLIVLAGPFIGFALTTGRLHTIFAYVAGGLVVLFLLLILLGMLSTRRGREALSEGCLDAILGGLFGG